MTPAFEYRHGAVPLSGGAARFRVWAPDAEQVELRVIHPEGRSLEMRKVNSGYWETRVENARVGLRYFYRIDGGRERPDPASRFQPEGVHGASELVEAALEWEDAGWSGLPLEQCVLYEVHAGTFTPEGTFDAIVPHLEYLRELGVTFLELMPVAQFPGGRNWGYDGVYPFAVQDSYGGAAGLRRLVNACHRTGLAVALDVVYNHLGPEGNYFAGYGPYFNGGYTTPWGPAINFDGPGSDEVRRFFIENALYWVRDFHVDALRLDAVHGIFDRSAYPFLEELGDAVRGEAARLNRRVQLIAESDLNDPRLIRPKDLGGFGLDAQWDDGFHHALRVLLTGDRGGYYQDFGEVRHLGKAFQEGYVYSGDYSRFRGRRHGASARDIPPDRFVVFSQNHDQVGNRMLGERLGSLVSLESVKLAAAAVILSPHVPLLFMGEEYGDPAPFLYFVSHSDPDLVEAVRRGRKEEFAAFDWRGETPDPQSEASFLASKLNLDLRKRDPHRAVHDYYKDLLRLRREVPALACLREDCMSVIAEEDTKVLAIRRWHEGDEVVLALCFSDAPVRVELPVPEGRWRKILDSADSRWLGPGTLHSDVVESPGIVGMALHPRSAVMYRRTRED